jgi:hypothetical protein
MLLPGSKMIYARANVIKTPEKTTVFLGISTDIVK